MGYQNKSIIFTVLVLAVLSACRISHGDDGFLESSQLASTEGSDQCSNEAMAKRRSAVFERSKSCAADAVGIGLVQTLNHARLAVVELRAFSAAIRAFNASLAPGSVMTLNVAKASLCSQVFLGTYVPKKSLSYLTSQLIDTAADNELASLDKLASSIVTAGGDESFKSFGKFMEDPNPEYFIKFLTKGAMAYGYLSEIAVSCAPVFASVTSVAAPSTVHIHHLGHRLLRVAMVGAIASCASAGLFNGIDVNTEYECLLRDLAFIEQQNKQILSMERARCEGLRELGRLPTTVPIMESRLNEIDQDTGGLTESSDARFRICAQVNERWGHCLASYPVSRRTMDHCSKLCTRMSNSVHRDFQNVMDNAGLQNSSIPRLVASYTDHCITPGNPLGLINNGITPCVRHCMDGRG